MKIVGFVASPRQEGNTSFLVEKVLAGAAAAGAETRVYHLNKLNIKGCQGCNHCKTHDGICKEQDDMARLYEELLTADGIVFGSPIYMSSVTAQAKLFLDRLYAFFNPGATSRMPQGKKLVLVFTQGNGDRSAYQQTFQTVEGVLKGLFGMQPLGTLLAAGVHNPGEAAQDSALLDKARSLGEQLAR